MALLATRRADGQRPCAHIEIGRRSATLSTMRLPKRTLTAATLAATATLVAGSQAGATARENGCQETWMHMPQEAGRAAMALLVTDDSGKPTQDFVVRYETLTSKRYIVITVHPGATPCRRSFHG